MLYEISYFMAFLAVVVLLAYIRPREEHLHGWRDVLRFILSFSLPELRVDITFRDKRVERFYFSSDEDRNEIIWMPGENVSWMKTRNLKRKGGSDHASLWILHNNILGIVVLKRVVELDGLRALSTAWVGFWYMLMLAFLGVALQSYFPPAEVVYLHPEEAVHWPQWNVFIPSVLAVAVLAYHVLYNVARIQSEQIVPFVGLEEYTNYNGIPVLVPRPYPDSKLGPREVDAIKGLYTPELIVDRVTRDMIPILATATEGIKVWRQISAQLGLRLDQAFEAGRKVSPIQVETGRLRIRLPGAVLIALAIIVAFIAGFLVHAYMAGQVEVGVVEAAVNATAVP